MSEGASSDVLPKDGGVFCGRKVVGPFLSRQLGRGSCSMVYQMGAYSADEKLLVHFFQDSLVGAAVAWYTNLEASQIRSWKDLATAFIRQYQYNTDMAPDRNQLQSMTKREHESIKEYAQRWRDLAAQVVPPMTEREMITIMVDTLPTFYYEKLIGYMPANFADLVFAGERIESGLSRTAHDGEGDDHNYGRYVTHVLL